MCGTVEDGHVGSQLGDQGRRKRAFDPRNLLEQLMLRCIRQELLVDAPMEDGYIGIGMFEPPELQP